MEARNCPFLNAVQKGAVRQTASDHQDVGVEVYEAPPGGVAATGRVGILMPGEKGFRQCAVCANRVSGVYGSPHTGRQTETLGEQPYARGCLFDVKDTLLLVADFEAEGGKRHDTAFKILH